MNRRDQYIEELLSAYLDGEVTADEQQRAEQLLDSSDDARQMLQQLRSISESLQAFPAQHLPRDFPQRVLMEAERAMGESTMERAADPVQANGRAWVRIAAIAATIAATLLLATISFRAFSTADRQTAGEIPHGPSVERPMEEVGEPGALVSEPTESTEPAGPTEPAQFAEPSESLAGPPSTDRRQLGHRDAPPGLESTDVEVVSPSEDIAEGAPAPSAEEAVPPIEEPWDVKLLFLVHVSITPEGLLSNTFERVLARHHIQFEDAIGMDTDLKNLLLEGRFIADDEVRQDEKEGGVSLVYVEADALQINDAAQRLRRQDEVRHVAYDLTLKPAHAQLLEHLHQRGRAEKMVEDQKPLVDAGFARSIARSAEIQERRSDEHVLLSVFSPGNDGTELEDATGVTVLPAPSVEEFPEIAPRPSTETPGPGEAMNPRMRTLFVLRIVAD